MTNRRSFALAAGCYYSQAAGASSSVVGAKASSSSATETATMQVWAAEGVLLLVMFMADAGGGTAKLLSCGVVMLTGFHGSSYA